MEVKIGKSYLTGISHEGKKISFEYPSYRGYYGEVAEAIDKAGLKRPSSAEIASLVCDAWKNPKGEYESQILNILKNNLLWEFTGNLYLPKSNEEVNNGVIIEYNPKIVNGKLSMDKNSLIKRLNENDSLVKFVPFGFKIGSQYARELEKNPYIVARYGEEGTEKIAEVALRYKNNPYLYSFNCVDEEKTRMSALNYCLIGGGELGIGGVSGEGCSDGHVFGVFKDELVSDVKK